MSPVSRFDAMGCEVLVGGATRVELEAIEELFRSRDRIFSRFAPGSELNRVNAASGEFVRVSETFGRALQRALELAAETGGIVDPTLGGALESAGYIDDFELLPQPAARSRCASAKSSTRSWPPHVTVTSRRFSHCSTPTSYSAPTRRSWGPTAWPRYVGLSPSPAPSPAAPARLNRPLSTVPPARCGLQAGIRGLFSALP